MTGLQGLGRDGSGTATSGVPRSEYLRNAWYAAGWSGEFSESPVARTIHGQPLVFFRGAGGALSALYDACPHRFAPLSMGRIDGDAIICGYHGLTFAGTGRCIRNPHGNGILPAALTVRSYPISEHYGMAWIWMGEAEAADPALVPMLPAFDNPAHTWIFGQLHVPAHYELIIDNLLDLSHVEFLHPFLSSPGTAERTTFRTLQEDGRVSALYDMREEPVAAILKLLWTDDANVGDQRVHMHWLAPSNLYLDVGIAPCGRPVSEGPAIPTVHLLTPETGDSTHYFWAAGRNRRQDDAQLGEMMRMGIQNTFEQEDEPMIRAVRSRMLSNDLFAHRPAILPMDEAAIRARRILRQLIDREAAAETNARPIAGA